MIVDPAEAIAGAEVKTKKIVKEMKAKFANSATSGSSGGRSASVDGEE